MKKFASILLLSATSLSAMAAGQATQNNNSFVNQQFQQMNNNNATAPSTTWFNHIGISGLMNVDAWDQSARNYLFNNNTSIKQASHSAIALSTLRLNLDAQVNQWINGHVSLFYADGDQPNGISGSMGNWPGNSIPNTRYYSALSSSERSGVDVDQAYIDIGNFARSPIMFRFGKQYVPFGNYQLDAITPSLTQQLSETRATAAELGFATQFGLHGAAYVFRTVQGRHTNDPDSFVASNYGNNINDGGLALGYTLQGHRFGLDAGAGYLYNMIAVAEINQFASNYYDRVGGLAAHIKLTAGQLSLTAKYVTATNKFATGDVQYVDNGTAKKASPSAGTVDAGWAFKAFGHNTQLIGTYQWSKQAFDPNTDSDEIGGNLALPQTRWGAEYDISVIKNVNVDLAFRHDNAYPRKDLGTSRSSNTGTVRLSVLL